MTKNIFFINGCGLFKFWLYTKNTVRLKKIVIFLIE